MADPKAEEAEFELVKVNFDGVASSVELLFQNINKVADAVKVTMWALVEQTDTMKKFLGANDVATPTSDALKLDKAMNAFSAEIATHANSLQAFNDKHNALKAKMAQRDAKRKLLNESNGNNAQQRAEFDEFDRTLKDELIKYYYSRYRRIGPELKKVLGTQAELFTRVLDGLSAMSELVDTKCKGESEISHSTTRGPKTVPRLTVRMPKPGEKQKPPVPSRSISHRPPPSKRDVNNNSGNANNTNEQQRNGVKANNPPVPQRSISDRNIKLPLGSVDELEHDKNAIRRYTDTSPPISPRSKDKGITPPLPSYPRPSGIAPPPSRPTSLQVNLDDIPMSGPSAVDTLLASAAGSLAATTAPDKRKVQKADSSPNLNLYTNTTNKTSSTTPTTITTQQSAPGLLVSSGTTPLINTSLISSAPGTTLISTSKATTTTATPKIAAAGKKSTGAVTPATTSTVKVSFNTPTSTTTSTPKSTTTTNNNSVVTPVKTLEPTINKTADEWNQMPRKAKGTTGVMPSIVTTRLNYFQGK